MPYRIYVKQKSGETVSGIEIHHGPPAHIRSQASLTIKPMAFICRLMTAGIL